MLFPWTRDFQVLPTSSWSHSWLIPIRMSSLSYFLITPVTAGKLISEWYRVTWCLDLAFFPRVLKLSVLMSACRTAGRDPIWWLLGGPHAVTHDFASSFCEADLVLRLHNSSTTAASVKVVIPDGTPALLGESSDDSSSHGQGGWQDVPLTSDPLTSALEGARPRKPPQSGGDGQPFAWCRSSSSQLVLEPTSTVEVPMRVCIFSPGMHDLSNFELHWSLRVGEADPGTEDRRRSLSGMSRARPFYLTARQAVNWFPCLARIGKSSSTEVPFHHLRAFCCLLACSSCCSSS